MNIAADAGPKFASTVGQNSWTQPPLLKFYPAERIEEWEVGAEARNARNDYPELIAPRKEDKKVEQGSLF